MLGKFRGKMGGMVYRVDPDAGQVVSEYNPTPSNPRTLAQTQQRAKMNLAGLLSKMTPYDALAGMASGKRAARSKFVSTILKGTSLGAMTSGAFEARLDHEGLKLSEGREAVLAATGTYAGADNTLTVSITNNLDSQNILFCRVVVYIAKASTYLTCLVKDTGTMTAGTASTVTFTIPANLRAAENIATIYVVPVFGDDAAVRVLYENAVRENDEFTDFISSVTRALATRDAFGASQFVQDVQLD